MHFQLLKDVKEGMDQKVDYFEFGREMEIRRIENVMTR
jgi:hypothetical protein